MNFPIRINDKLAGVFGTANSGITAPSRQAKEVFAELAKQADAELAKLKKIKEEDIANLNKLIREQQLPVIGVAAKKEDNK